MNQARISAAASLAASCCRHLPGLHGHGPPECSSSDQASGQQAHAQAQGMHLQPAHTSAAPPSTLPAVRRATRTCGRRRRGRHSVCLYLHRRRRRGCRAWTAASPCASGSCPFWRDVAVEGAARSSKMQAWLCRGTRQESKSWSGAAVAAVAAAAQMSGGAAPGQPWDPAEQGHGPFTLSGV